MPSKHKKVYHKSEKEKTFHKRQLDKWLQTIEEQLPNLSKSQAYVLALWSFAMVIIRLSAITSVSFFLACLYGMRWWIESGFKAIKSGFFQWNRTKMEDPAWASRLWLVISVSMIWIVSVGGEVDESIPASTVPDITENGYPVRIRRRHSRSLYNSYITHLH